MIFVIITATIGGLQIFAEPRLFDPATAGGVGGSHRQFQTTVLYLWEMAFFRQNFGEAAAIAWLLFLIIIIIGLINFMLPRRIATGDGAKARRGLLGFRRPRGPQEQQAEQTVTTPGSIAEDAKL